ncbi:MAG: trypsin-like peptidase domain-containing protein [Caldilineaceae bacterium]
MNGGRFVVTVAVGCLAVIALIVVAAVFFVTPMFRISTTQVEQRTEPVPQVTVDRTLIEEQRAVPTFTPVMAVAADTTTTSANQTDVTPNGQAAELRSTSNLLANRYQNLGPGVVSINVLTTGAEGSGLGAGSGFILDNEGHIVTNNHVIDQAGFVTVVFFNGVEEQAEIIGADDDSDLAVLRVATLPEDVYPLPLADSDEVQVGDWAIAIGNPFGLGGSMTLGIISALGRVIPSGVAGFSIPQAIQTDAAINPGNSGGPLLNLAGQVIGVNAQIRTGGEMANSGVGFAIPANVVRQVVPVLIAQGSYQWPWAGIQGVAINLLLSEANNLESQQGAYLYGIIPGSPAATAGLRGSTGTRNVNGLPVPVGGDVVVAVDSDPVADFDDLLNEIAFKTPGDEVIFTVLRGGEQVDVPIVLEARPDLTQQQ